MAGKHIRAVFGSAVMCNSEAFRIAHPAPVAISPAQTLGQLGRAPAGSSLAAFFPLPLIRRGIVAVGNLI
jgi:hypothetical protein